MVAIFNKVCSGLLAKSCKMRPDTNSTRTEALLISLFRRCGVSRGWHWSSGGEAGTEGNLTEKGRPFRAQDSGAWCKEVRQPVWYYAVSYSWLCVYAEE